MNSLTLLASALFTLLPQIASAGTTLGTLGRNVPGSPSLFPAWSQICFFTPYCGIVVPGGGLTILSLIVIDTVMLFIGASAIVVVIYGAIRIITSLGEQDKIKTGRQAILYGLLGLFLAIISDALFRWLTLFLYAAAS